MTPLPYTARAVRRWFALGLVALTACLGGPRAKADPMYSITSLGTLPGMNSSIATAINNEGQVAGYSYSSTSTLAPLQANTATQGSFLYSNGQMTLINPPGGLATSINNSGQVVGGNYYSINDSGQYVDQSYPINSSGQRVDQNSAEAFFPGSINNAGEMTGFIYANTPRDTPLQAHPALLTNGRITDLFSMIPHPDGATGAAGAINQKGDVFITMQSPNLQYYLYQASTGQITNLTAITNMAALGGSYPRGLNDTGLIVGTSYLYDLTTGKLSTLSGLLPLNSGWTKLNATSINDLGQIAGQGQYNGQEVAFLMTPDAVQAPEPAALAVWGILGVAAALRFTQVRQRPARGYDQ